MPAEDSVRIPEAGEGRLIVVSNRLPLSVKKTRDGRWRSEPDRKSVV